LAKSQLCGDLTLAIEQRADVLRLATWWARTASLAAKASGIATDVNFFRQFEFSRLNPNFAKNPGSAG